MEKENSPYNYFFAAVISLLLSVSPMLLLFEHHQWEDVIDKIFLFATAFLIAFANLKFQNNRFDKSVSVSALLTQTILLNLMLFGINALVRLPFWIYVQTHRPPIFILLSIDLVRSMMIALVSYFIVAFLAKNRIQEYNKQKIKTLENLSLQLQIASLTAQLQPHFFFNTLNVLSELIQTDIKKSEKYIQQLSQFFRYVLATQQHNFVSLTEEMAFINTYLYLISIRFENEMTIKLSLQNQDKYSIPSLCTLIVFENIIKHNNISAMHIDVSLSEQDKFLKISNSLNRKKNVAENSLGYGLENINKKCELLLQKSIRIQTSENRFEVEIPIIETKNI